MYTVYTCVGPDVNLNVQCWELFILQALQCQIWTAW